MVLLSLETVMAIVNIIIIAVISEYCMLRDSSNFIFFLKHSYYKS